MTFCQSVLKAQFPNVEGLECTLFQSKNQDTRIVSGTSSYSITEQSSLGTCFEYILQQQVTTKYL